MKRDNTVLSLSKEVAVMSNILDMPEGFLDQVLVGEDFKIGMEAFSKGWNAAICKVMTLLSKSSILSPTQKKLLWREVKALKGL